jgi:hypothetical protein
LNRRYQQAGSLLPDMLHGTSLQIEAMAQADSLGALFERLEAEGIALRIDPGVVPTMFRGAILSEAELRLLRGIEGVVRMGHVQRIERDAIVLEQGRAPTDEGTVHVHCAARGLRRRPLVPIFQPGRVVVQTFLWGFACYQFAALGVVEALLGSDEEKNALCPPIPYWDANPDYPTAFLAIMAFTSKIGAYPKVAAWSKSTRLNGASGMASHRDDPRVVASRERVKRFGLQAAMNVQKLVSAPNG